MAKRKKTVHRRKHHRRRMSGIGGIDVKELAIIGGGAVAAKLLTNMAAKSTSVSKFSPYTGIVIGVLLNMSKKPLLKGLGYGAVAEGIVTALGAGGLNVISGIENVISGIGYPPNQYAMLPYRKVAGIGNDPRITKPNFSGSGMNQMNVISGVHAATEAANNIY